MNSGQLAMVLRAKFLVDVESFDRIRGLPISLSELATHLSDQVEVSSPPLNEEEANEEPIDATHEPPPRGFHTKEQ